MTKMRRRARALAGMGALAAITLLALVWSAGPAIAAARTTRPAHRSIGGIVAGVIVLAVVVVTSVLLQRRRSRRRFRRDEPDEPQG